jgi:hypothetical protein
MLLIVQGPSKRLSFPGNVPVLGAEERFFKEFRTSVLVMWRSKGAESREKRG